ncbi:protein phosphatase 2C domain-containing protein [Candidatus Berkiella aquae]|uniref:Protein phosphatase 2C domain-containing protein n=1 Tax=Candidatus Berkiella aquae TaxID=295108 RepID=A0A0Q9YJM6_9GAMM|nr:protein phosphatase 2C domain-containing protein [Candidatus Berkiella aquae]MCS5711354.1 protein phosphatase 2C domain-containing protein [Candidatus Berkiella aquae]
MTIKVKLYEATHIGKRDQNQDFCAYMQTEQASCFVVADGLGGHQRGEIASSFLCKAVMSEVQGSLSVIQNNPEQGIQDFLFKSYEKMRKNILEEFGPLDTHTTFVLAWFNESLLITAHVGDSRIYRVNPETMLWRTPDHTLVQDLFEQGLITEDEIGKHPEQNQLLRTVNLREKPDIDIVIHPPLNRDETLILCTDGFWTDTSITEIVKLANTPDFEAAFQQQIERLSQKPYSDNITLQVIKII